MEAKNKKRIVLGLIILLLLINLSAIITIGYNKYERNKYEGKEYITDSTENSSPHSRMKLYVKRELELSDNQFKEYCRMMDENFRKTEKNIEKIKVYKKEIISEINKEKPDSLVLMMLSDSIGEQHRQINMKMNRHFLSVKQMLEPDQQLKLNELLLRMEERFNHRGQRESRKNKNGQGYRHRHGNKNE